MTYDFLEDHEEVEGEGKDGRKGKKLMSDVIFLYRKKEVVDDYLAELDIRVRVKRRHMKGIPDGSKPILQ